MLPEMGGDPGAAPPAAAQTRFSADGFWWWDGAQWRAAYSEDRLWRWNGQAWEAARPSPAARSSGPGAGVAIGLTVAIFAGILVLVSIVVVVVLLTMGNQIANVFENVVTALSTPSP
jgi:Flp pilus assembly pilin Flp